MGFYKVHFFNLLNKTTRIETHKWLLGAEPPTSIVDTHSKPSLLILFYIKIVSTPIFVEQVFFRNYYFLPQFFLKNLDVLTIL